MDRVDPALEMALERLGRHVLSAASTPTNGTRPPRIVAVLPRPQVKPLTTPRNCLDLNISQHVELSSNLVGSACGQLERVSLYKSTDTFKERTATSPAKWGGARNRADRESYGLTAAQLRKLCAAAARSVTLDLIPNRMITIHWERAGVPLDGMAEATGRFLDSLSRAIRRRGFSVAYIWVHENGPAKGAHCHILTRVDPSLVPVLTRLQRGWIERISGAKYRKATILSRPVGGLLGLETSNPALLAVNAEAALRYILKGTTPEIAQAFGLDRSERGGRILGKRCGISQTLSAPPS